MGFDSIHVFDLRSLTQAKRRAIVDSAIQRITGMAVHDNHLLVAGDEYVQVFDVTDPTNVRPLHLLEDERWLAVKDSQGAHDLEVFSTGDDRVYVAATSQGTNALGLFRIPAQP